MPKSYNFIVFIFLISVNFLWSQNWQTEWEDAKELSKQTDTKLILVFSGSDWCIPCIKLEKEIWNDPTFIAYADKNFVLFRADFPKRKKNKLPEGDQQRNDLLASNYNPNGYFPLVVVFNSKGTVVGQLGYEKISPQEYINRIEKL